MNKLETIINKAESGGWQPVSLKIEAQKQFFIINKHKYREEFNLDGTQKTATAKEVIELENLWNKYVSEVCFLDPLFWQALGKASGWIEGVEFEIAHQFYNRNLTQSLDHALDYLLTVI